MQSRLRKWMVGVGVVLVAAVAMFVIARVRTTHRPLARMALADGRVLQVEGVSYGTNHVIGRRSLLLERFGPWIPAAIRDHIVPDRPRSEIKWDVPVLVVWVNAIDPKTGRHVDCQGIRVEFVGAQGDLCSEDTHSWFGGAKFWRVGHVFGAFPRSEAQLTIRATPWQGKQTSTATIPNPHRTPPQPWSGKPVPQEQRVGELAVVLSSLVVRTNGSPDNYWETPSPYLDPLWELRRGGEPAGGWQPPEWIAEDATGNRNRFLGVHQPVLRFSVMFYPDPTNLSVVASITNSPAASLSGLQSNLWWNVPGKTGTTGLTILGLFPPGTHVFSAGVLQTNPPAGMGPVQGGAPSGWIGQSQRLSPTRVQEWSGHYTRSPVLYVRAAPLDGEARFGVRLRDEQGRYWAAKPEPQGVRQDIRPFLVEGLPDEVDSIVAEVVVLRPVHASFDVDTRAFTRP